MYDACEMFGGQNKKNHRWVLLLALRHNFAVKIIHLDKHHQLNVMGKLIQLRPPLHQDAQLAQQLLSGVPVLILTGGLLRQRISVIVLTVARLPVLFADPEAVEATAQLEEIQQISVIVLPDLGYLRVHSVKDKTQHLVLSTETQGLLREQGIFRHPRKIDQQAVHQKLSNLKCCEIPTLLLRLLQERHSQVTCILLLIEALLIVISRVRDTQTMIQIREGELPPRETQNLPQKRPLLDSQQKLPKFPLHKKHQPLLIRPINHLNNPLRRPQLPDGKLHRRPVPIIKVLPQLINGFSKGSVMQAFDPTAKLCVLWNKTTVIR